MKKQFLTTCAIAAISLCATNDSYGQWNGTSPAPVIEANPGYDDVRFLPATGSIRSIRGETDNYFEIYGNHDGGNGPSMFMFNHATTNPAFSTLRGGIQFWSSEIAGSNPTDLAFEIKNHPSGSQTWSSLFRINKNGNIGIGNDNPNHDLDIIHTSAYPSTNMKPTLKIVDNFYTNTTNTSPAMSDYNLLEVWANTIFDTYPLPTVNASPMQRMALLVTNHAAGPKVAVNKTTADYTLDVGGSIRADYDLVADYNGQIGNDLTVNNRLTVMHNSGFGTYPSSNTLDVVHINGNVAFDANNPNQAHRAIRGKSDDYGIVIWANDHWGDGAGILLNGQSGLDDGGIQFVTPNNNPNASGFSYWTANASGQWTNKLMEIKKDGQVMIGNAPTVPYTNGQPTYKLYVENGILTERVKVATVTGGQWSDFVFDDTYELKSLNEVKNFISENKHLPDVPSACEVEENGYDLTKMDATLLQKIEELTLYILQQQKEIDELKSKLNR